MNLTAARSAIPYHPAFAGAAMVQKETRSRWMSDDALTADTIRHMQAYIAQDATSAPVQQAAAQVFALTHTPQPSAEDLARATHQWMRSHVRYVEDADLAAGLSDRPEEAEVLIRPADLFSMQDPQGDCDDFTMGTAALLTALSIPCAIKTAKCDPRDRSLWSHVYVVAQLPAGGLVLDSSHGPDPGWEVSPIFKSRLWPVHPMPKTNTLRSGFIDYTTGDTGGEYTGAGAGQEPAGPVTPSGGGSSIDWGNIIGVGEGAAAKILGARYSVAQLNPGQYMRNADGSVYYQGTPGQNMNLPGVSSTGNMGTYLLLGVGLLVAFMAMSGHRQ